MARVTVEDCVQKVPNRFELVLLAAQRARNLSRGEELSVDRDNDKNPVVALREIADETIDLDRIEQDLVKSLSRAPEPEPADEEVLDLIPTDQNIFGLQDISAEEEAAGLPVENEEMSPEDMEAAIEAELGGRQEVSATCSTGGRAGPTTRPAPSPSYAPDGVTQGATAGGHRRRRRPTTGSVAAAEKVRSGYDPKADTGLIDDAYAVAEQAHGTQRRDNGDPYITHPLAVADILAGYRLDTASIATGLLHDVIEDTPVKLPELDRRFGHEIATLVDGVTKLTRLELESDRTKQAENFRKLVLAMSRDIRVLLVKLADRLHNMRTLHFVREPERRRRIARETMEIYAPLAERIGMDAVKTELQTLAFRELEPEAFATIQARLELPARPGRRRDRGSAPRPAPGLRGNGHRGDRGRRGARSRPTRSGRRCTGGMLPSSNCPTSWRSASWCRRGRLVTWRWARCTRHIR